MTQIPALSLAALPKRRNTIIEIAKAAEQRGVPGIYGPSMGDALSLFVAIAAQTERIEMGTSIMPIYFRAPHDFAATAAFLHEISNGRFRFGIGVSHEPALTRMGIKAGKPLADMRQFVEDLRATERVGELPPIVLATLRDKMIKLSEEIGQGMVFANGARSRMAHSLSQLSQDAREGQDFFIGNMVPTCISDDKAAAAAVNRRTLSGYVTLPNYRNYWKEAGYEEEMTAVEEAIAAKEPQRIPECMSDRWLADTTLFGSASEVREGIEAWFDAGIKTPIIVPSSAAGNQLTAIEEFFDLFK